MNGLALAPSAPVCPPIYERDRIFGSGEMARLIRNRNWTATPLGDTANWPESLTTMVNLALSSPIPTSIYWGPQNVLLYNDGYRVFTAHRHPKALGSPGSQVWQEAWHIVGPQIERTMQTGEVFHAKNFLVPIEVDGRLADHYWDYSFSPIHDASTGRVVGVYNTCVDATDSFLVARERNQLAQRLQQVMESTSDGVICIDRNWRFTYLNPGALAHSGPFQDLIGKNIWEALPGLVYEGSPNVHHYRRTMDFNEPGEFESFYGEPLNHWMHIQVRPAPDGIVLFTKDITKQRETTAALKKAARDLAESEEELRWTIGLSSQFPWIADADGHILKNRGDVTKLTGHAVEEVLGDDWTKMMVPEDAERMQRVWSDCVRTGRIYDIEHRVTTKSGAIQWFRSRAYPRRDADGRIVRWYGITDDIDEQKRRAAALERTAAALAASEEELRWTLKMSTQNPWTADGRGKVLAVDDSFRVGGLSREHLLGEGWKNVIHPDDVSRVSVRWDQCVATGEMFDVEHRRRSAEGEYRWFRARACARTDAEGRTVKWYGTSEDIHTRKIAEEGLRTSEKLAAVGRLATSIAHEINNPLEAVTNLLYLARTSHDLPDILGYIVHAEQELHRASVITNQTLRFQRQASAPTALDTRDLVDNCLAVFQGKLQNSSVVPEMQLHAGQPVQCFEGEIRQIFLNLVGNAVDSMQPMGGGRLLIRTRESTHWQTGKQGLTITVADTGGGMSAEVQKKLFEPFFTTKGLAGTGLGLWVSRDIVARHRGTLRLRSKPMRRRSDFVDSPGARGGTVFRLFLPFDGVERHCLPKPAGQADPLAA